MNVALVRRLGLALGPLLALPLVLFYRPDPAHPLIGAVAGVGVLMAIWWTSEALPLAATAVIPMVAFPLLGVAAPSVTAAAYMNSVIFLYIGGSLIADAMERWQLHRRIALGVTYRVGGGPDRLVLGFVLATGFVSMWISNVATTVMMLPIALAVVKSLEERFGADRARPLTVNILLAIAFASSIGGVATLVGTPTNLAFVKIHAASFPSAPPVSFGQWFLIGLPVAVVGLLVAWLVMTRLALRVPRDIEVDAEVVGRELRGLGRASYEERVVVLVGTITALLWIFRGDLVLGAFTLPGWARLSPLFAKVDDSTVAVAMALVLFVWPSRQKPGQAILAASAFKDLPWGAILLFGGGFALADGFVSSGFTAHLAGVFAAIEGVPAWATVLLACLGVALVTEFVSNIATVQMFMPVLASLAVARGIDPLVMMIPATMTSSMAFMFPVGTPPNAVVFGSERLRIADMVRVGLLVKVALLLVTITLSAVLVPIVFAGVPR